MKVELKKCSTGGTRVGIGKTHALGHIIHNSLLVLSPICSVLNSKQSSSIISVDMLIYYDGNLCSIYECSKNFPILSHPPIHGSIVLLLHT